MILRFLHMIFFEWDGRFCQSSLERRGVSDAEEDIKGNRGSANEETEVYLKKIFHEIWF